MYWAIQRSWFARVNAQSRGGVVFCLTYASIIVTIIIVTDIYDIVIIINAIIIIITMMQSTILVFLLSF